MGLRPVVFLGPSLPLNRARELLDADYRPPAAAGDILRAARIRPPAIALIDGVFTHVPTVRHREILWTLSRGIPVFGAASLGALRAAELAEEGMIGVGLVYRWLRRYPLTPDDAVAVTHAPPSLGCTPLSDPLVDILRSLRKAERAGAITSQDAARIAANARACAFGARRLVELADQAAGLGAAVVDHRVPQKAQDTKALLRVMATHALKGTWPHPKPMTPAPVHAWLDDLVAEGLSPSDFEL